MREDNHWTITRTVRSDAQDAVSSTADMTVGNSRVQVILAQEQRDGETKIVYIYIPPQQEYVFECGGWGGESK